MYRAISLGTLKVWGHTKRIGLMMVVVGMCAFIVVDGSGKEKGSLVQWQLGYDKIDVTISLNGFDIIVRCDSVWSSDMKAIGTMQCHAKLRMFDPLMGRVVDPGDERLACVKGSLFLSLPIEQLDTHDLGLP